MAERSPGRWQYRLLFLFLAGLVAFAQLLPIDQSAGQLPGPDVMLLMVLSWTVLRPSLLPIWLIGAVLLIADFLFMRPPGLWAALAVLGCEFLRSRRILIRNASFLTEWTLVAGVILVMTLANALILSMFAVPQPTAGLTVMRMLITILCYPVILVLAGRAFGLRKTGVERQGLGTER